jgi:hypothetical protein
LCVLWCVGVAVFERLLLAIVGTIVGVALCTDWLGVWGGGGGCGAPNGVNGESTPFVSC